MKGRNSVWTKIVLATAILVYVIYLGLAVYTYYHLPPIPEKVVTQSGEVLFTKQDVIEGKYLVQKYGLLDYGSFLGFGGYFGIEYVAYTAEILNQSLGADASKLIKPLTPVNSGVVVVTDQFGKAYNNAVNFYSNFFGSNANSIGLKPDLITNKTAIEKIVAFFTWGVLIAEAGYTNGFPFMPGITTSTTNITLATWAVMIVLFVLILPLVAYIIIKFLDYWREPRITIDLPPPSSTQRLSLLGIALAVLGLSVQGLLGGYLMEKYIDPSTLLEIVQGVNNVLPFNVARVLHIDLAILWMAISWVSFDLFVLPYLGISLSKRQVLIILGAGVVVALGILLGAWASYLQLLPTQYNTWFIIGSQGRPIVNAGTLWLILLTVLLAYLSVLNFKASNTAPEAIRTLVRIVAISLAGTAAGAFIGALPIVAPWPHFTLDDYFRWITIHSFVEGFWPPLMVTILLILLVIAGMVPPKLAEAVAGLDATLEIATGLLGTAHHYYFGGQPVFWMYIGAVFSTLEVIPLGFLFAYVIVLWRRGEYKTDLQKTLLTFTLLAGIGGGAGAAVFGAGILNIPAINYYLHGLQFTMVHAHVGMPFAFALPTMLMWTIAFTLAGAFNAKTLSRLRKASLIFFIGFYLQAASLSWLGSQQFPLVLQEGYWAAKTYIYPNGAPGFYQSLGAVYAVLSRTVGDVVAAIAIVTFLIYIVKALPSALRAIKAL